MSDTIDLGPLSRLMGRFVVAANAYRSVRIVCCQRGSHGSLRLNPRREPEEINQANV